MQNDQPQELAPQNLIRTETALSRFPMHRLAKRGSVSIEVKETNPNGEIRTKWEVSYNSKFGQPGPLAYKLDTLIVNRRIEAARPSIAKILRLGSLRDIAEELNFADSGNNKKDIKKALMQNAFAAITAKITYTTNDKTERTLEAAFTRYSVIFTGEQFPDGSKADAVYLLLNDIYMQVLNTAQTRPLDYDYLKELAPAPQRFYEILSYQMFAALKYHHPHAKLAYSDFCTYSTQTRYYGYFPTRVTFVS